MQDRHRRTSNLEWTHFKEDFPDVLKLTSKLEGRTALNWTNNRSICVAVDGREVADPMEMGNLRRGRYDWLALRARDQ
ncbi:hypothetical protein PROFUN_04684 [Planoprotostelium fungivorum]|uniref:Uncharacterized protein n=1 Tax=Planoprotostelium fungivorum TaxID=1890364 RepID=A0A2P6NFX2_9EUKA|nr:hypothetical protein PROFUN_04684 [Planoprotostelium fungivorum]